MTNGCEFDQSAVYEIRVEGIVDSSWSDWFGDFNITVQGNETVMRGNAIDQSALHGMLAKIVDLGLALISLRKITHVEDSL